MRSRNIKPQPFCDRIGLLTPSQDTAATLCNHWFWPHFSQTSLSPYGSESWGRVGHHSWGNRRQTPNGQPMVVLPLGSAHQVSHPSAVCRKRSKLTTVNLATTSWVRWAGYDWVWAAESSLLASSWVKQDQHEAFGTRENRNHLCRHPWGASAQSRSSHRMSGDISIPTPCLQEPLMLKWRTFH